MKITIDGTEYKLHFGVAFIHELDEKHNFKTAGGTFGTGVNNIYARLQTPNPYPLYEALHAALITQIDLTEDQFDDWVDSLKSVKEFTDFFDKFVKQLETQRQTKPLITNYKKVMKDLEKQSQETLETVQKSLEKPTEE